MSSVRMEILWTPVHSNKFITWGTELSLYREEVASPDTEIKFPKQRLSSNTYANLVATSSELSYIKAVDIHPNYKEEVLLAVGQANGKVTLTTFGSGISGFVPSEYVPRHGRQCHVVKWSNEEPSLLAVGLDKHRSDYGMLIWDVKAVAGCPPLEADSVKTYCDMPKPLIETANSETITSLAWLPHHPRTMVVGSNYKHLRIYDLRDGGRIQGSTPTKAVLGLNVESLSPFRVASYVDSTIAIWDLRSMEKPTFILNQSQAILKVAWCPNRSGLLGSLLRENVCVGLHDIQISPSGTEDAEPTILERNFTLLQSTASTYLTSFAWNSNSQTRFLASDSSGRVMEQSVSERISVSWSPTSELAWTSGKTTVFTYKQPEPDSTTCFGYTDISLVMKQRAKKEYGLKPQLKENGELTTDEALKRLWTWLDFCKNEKIEIPGSPDLPGIRHILKMDTGGMNSDAVNLQWVGLDSNESISCKVFQSEERQCALGACGWKWSGDGYSQLFSTFLTDLENQGQYTRAAALAVFHLHLRRSIQSLQKGSQESKHLGKGINSSLGVVAMALSGFSIDKDGLWQEMCHEAALELDDPYLRGIFAFLTTEGDSYDAVLNEEGIAVLDRVAFACLFLSDVRLSEYINQLYVKLASRGQVDGIVLSGLSSEGIELLQRYVDITGDIQSVSLITMHGLAHQISQEPQLNLWIECYRSLLDMWQLWHERCHFDITLRQISQVKQPSASLSHNQVFVTCNFCGKSITAFMQGMGYGRGGASVPTLSRLASTNRPKMSACPNCHKPLPRCAVCLANMGTAAGTSRNNSSSESNLRLTPFTNWFSWCQSCRHGGHSNHIMEWFKSHNECPVTGCSCHCEAIDKHVSISLGKDRTESDTLLPS